MDLVANVTTTNETLTSVQRTPQWTFLLGLRTVIMISSIGLNVGVSLYHITSVKVTSFSVYLIALFIANAVHGAVVTPIEVTRELFGERLMGRSLCLTYDYFRLVVSLGPVMFHALIAVSRIWAVRYPVSYKQRQTRRTAAWLCLASLGYMHIVAMPGYLMGLLYSHPPEKPYSCVMNRPTPAMKSWGRAESILDRFMPLVLILLTYVYVHVALWRKKRRRLGMASTDTHAMQPTVKSGNAAPMEPKSADPSAKPKRHIRASFVLTLTVISITIGWLPADAVFFAFWFLDIPINLTAISAVMLMYSFRVFLIL